LDVLAELGVREKPMVHVFNKMDLLAPEQMVAVRERLNNLVPGSLFVSAESADGLEPLRRELLRRQRAAKRTIEVRIPISDGRTLAALYRDGEVLAQRTEGTELVISARLAADVVARLAQQPAVTVS
jgi:GTP-binding protein HflX